MIWIEDKIRIIVSGGGTGGHIFPAISIANELKNREPNVEILFVGALGRMEMERVPAAGYRIEGLPVQGLIRKLSLKNFSVLFNLIRSMIKARKMIRTFKPHVVVGVGGYASGPICKAASKAGIPVVLQEQNSYAGVTNKLLAKVADAVCVAYPDMGRFFPKEKIVLTGNPIRQDLLKPVTREESAAYFGLDPNKKTVLVVGGSLGARTINSCILNGLDEISGSGVQFIWQTGRLYAEEVARAMDGKQIPGLVVKTFLDRMDLAYGAADLVVSRAGAGTISELTLLGKAMLLVPSPNVAEDHQTKNAKALVKVNAAALVPDAGASVLLLKTVFNLVKDSAKLTHLAENALKMALPGSAEKIADKVFGAAARYMLKGYSNIFFLGVGGIGMSALARYFAVNGKNVGGYDRSETELTKALNREGIQTVFADDIKKIPACFVNASNTLVVVTPAIPANSAMLQWFRQKEFKMLKRAQILGFITQENNGICVAGTHGKTTVSTMTAHILTESGHGCNAFLGGISRNYNTNCIIDANSNLVVIEADEFDRSFHNLMPGTAVITSVDADHLDIYGTYAEVVKSFEHFCTLIKPGGALVLKKGVNIAPVLNRDVKFYSYSVTEAADFYANDFMLEDGLYRFTFNYPGGKVTGVKLGVPGKLNVENAVAALSQAWLNGADISKACKALAGFKGIKRRFEVYLATPDFLLVDDYAHHPEELAATISSARQLYPDRRITGVFQPHLYSRTRDLADGFARSLSMLDEVVLLDIYPARELPIEGVSSQMVFEQITSAKKTLCTKNELLAVLRKIEKPGVLLVMGAGDIDTMLNDIKIVFENR